MTEKTLAAKEAIRRARAALRKGDKDVAHAWAEKAASLSPNLEDAWLLLAATSRPQLSIRYLERALAINPQSERARKGMLWAKKRLRPASAPIVEETQPTPKIEETQPTRVVGIPLSRPMVEIQPVKAVAPPPKRSFLRQSLPAFLLTVLIVSAVWALTPQITSFASDFNATPSATEAHWGAAEINKPTYTPSPTATFTSTPTFTLTPTPTDTETPLPTNTAIPPTKTPVPAPPPQDDYVYSGGAKYVLVDISEQHLYAYEGNTLVFSFVASTGMNNATATGSFSVLNKIPSAYGSTWDIWMPYWLGIYWSGTLQNGIHALPIMSNGATLWAGYLGTPISYGCVVLGTYEAQLLYNWVDVGTPVDIQW